MTGLRDQSSLGDSYKPDCYGKKCVLQALRKVGDGDFGGPEEMYILMRGGDSEDSLHATKPLFWN